MNLKEELRKELKEAMRSGDQTRKNTIRMTLSSIKLLEVDKGPLDEGCVNCCFAKRNQDASRSTDRRKKSQSHGPC